MVPEPELPLPVVLPELLAGGVVAPDCPELLPEAPLDEGEVVELLLPLAPPMLLPCAPKCASHSERETWPSLFLSTSLKFGAEVEAPAAAEPLVVLDWLVVLPLEDVLDSGLLDCAEVLGGVAEPLELELCAKEAPDSASSAEAVAPTRTFSIMCVLLCGGEYGEIAAVVTQAPCPSSGSGAATCRAVAREQASREAPARGPLPRLRRS